MSKGVGQKIALATMPILILLSSILIPFNNAYASYTDDNRNDMGGMRKGEVFYWGLSDCFNSMNKSYTINLSNELDKMTKANTLSQGYSGKVMGDLLGLYNSKVSETNCNVLSPPTRSMFNYSFGVCDLYDVNVAYQQAIRSLNTATNAPAPPSQFASSVSCADKIAEIKRNGDAGIKYATKCFTSSNGLGVPPPIGGSPTLPSQTGSWQDCTGPGFMNNSLDTLSLVATFTRKNSTPALPMATWPATGDAMRNAMIYFDYETVFSARCLKDGATPQSEDLPQGAAGSRVWIYSTSFQSPPFVNGKVFYDSGQINSNTKVWVYSTPQATAAKTCSALVTSLQNQTRYTAALQFAATSNTTTPPPVTDGTTPGGTTSQPPICSANSGALGWILCPVLTLVANAGEFLWEKIEDQLNIDAGILFGAGSGTQTAWDTFRNIADVLLVIFFLVVIVSQLTGIGISNYGIKKALPKVIIAAILINVSFFICQLAVDLSDIIGASAGDLLRNIVEYNGAPGLTPGPGMVFAWIGGSLLIGGGIAFFSPQTFGAILGGIVLLVITAFLAVLVLFVALAIRQMGIVILVVISPLAIACMVLPNVSKLFDKWFGLFKTLLIVYPICAVLVGGATMASTIILNANQGQQGKEMMNLLAVIIPSIAFFFVPTLVKQSVNGIGQIGAKLGSMGSRIGNRVGGGLQNRVKNADTWKNMQNKADARRPAFTRGGRARQAAGLAAMRQADTADRRNQRIIDQAKARGGAPLPSDFSGVDDNMDYGDKMSAFQGLLDKETRTDDDSALMSYYATRLKPDDLQMMLGKSRNPLSSKESMLMATTLKNSEAWNGIKAETPDLRNTVDNVMLGHSDTMTSPVLNEDGSVAIGTDSNGETYPISRLAKPNIGSSISSAGSYSVGNFAEMKSPAVQKAGEDLVSQLNNASEENAEQLRNELNQFASELSKANADPTITTKWTGYDRGVADNTVKSIRDAIDASNKRSADIAAGKLADGANINIQQNQPPEQG